MRLFNYMQNVGKCRHVISFYDGLKTHSDGSAFFDVRIFSSKREAHRFMRGLIAAGYAKD